MQKNNFPTGKSDFVWFFMRTQKVSLETADYDIDRTVNAKFLVWIHHSLVYNAKSICFEAR